jgi:hypothetical protein
MRHTSTTFASLFNPAPSFWRAGGVRAFFGVAVTGPRGLPVSFAPVRLGGRRSQVRPSFWEKAGAVMVS